MILTGATRCVSCLASGEFCNIMCVARCPRGGIGRRARFRFYTSLPYPEQPIDFIRVLLPSIPTPTDPIPFFFDHFPTSGIQNGIQKLAERFL